MILLMTATETYPNLREGETSSTSSTLERGGKDVHEGYGRVNLDAAVDSLLRSYGIGSVVTDTLGRPPTLTDVSVLGQRLAWARNVQLVSGAVYSFILSVPAGADYDLYLYNSTGTTYGEPAIVAKSTTATTGGTEQFWVTAPYTGTYYIVVKRATETTGSGAFTLASSSPSVNVTLNTPGLSSASNVVHYTQNSVSKTGSIVANTFSDYADTATTLTIDNPIYVSTTQRYITTDPTSFTIQSDGTITVNYKTQYYITVNSGHDVPTASQWVDQGGTFTASVTSPTEIVAGDHQWVCTGYSLDGGSSQSGTSYIFTNVQAAHTIVFNWKAQYYLAMSTNFGSVSPGSGWHDAGSTVTISATAPSASSGEQYVWNGWIGTGSGNYTGTDNQSSVTMNGVVTEAASWTHQYYLNVTSPYGSPTPISGWFDAGTSITASVNSPVAGSIVTQYVCIGWAGTGSVSTSGTATSVLFTIDQPSSITWNWKTEYFLPTNLLVTIILIALIGSAIYLLLRRRQNGKSEGGAPKPTSPSSAAQKLAAPIRVMRWLLL